MASQSAASSEPKVTTHSYHRQGPVLQLHAPSAVTHCVSAFFTRRASGPDVIPNLVVAKHTRLEIYDVRVPGDATTSQEGARLELVASYPLWGVVQDMAVLRSRAPGKQRDALILTFREAKVSVLEWDCEAHCVRTGSLHCLENERELQDGHNSSVHPPLVATDPQGRCAVVLLCGQYLALLPTLDVDTFELELLEAADTLPPCATVGNSYLLDLRTVQGIRDVRSVAFLHGYAEPVLAVLHENDPTWPGLYRDRKDTCQLTALSIGLSRRHHPVIWSAKALPSDSSRVVAVPTGGALVLSRDLVLFCTQGGHSALALNSSAMGGQAPRKIDFATMSSLQQIRTAAEAYAREYADNVPPDAAPAAARDAKRAEGLEVVLDGCACSWLTSNVCLLGLRSGAMLLLQLRQEGTKMALRAVPAPSGPVVSCAVALTQHLLFLASELDDSMLIRYQPQRQATDSGPAAKRRRLDGSSSLPFSPDTAPAVFGPFSFKPQDKLLNVGPLREIATADLTPASEDGVPADRRRTDVQLLACVGEGRHGALHMLRRGLLPVLLAQVPISQVHGLWALHHKPPEAPGAMIVPSQVGAGSRHAFLLASVSGKATRVVQTAGEELQDITRSGDVDFFCCDSPTVCAGNLADSQYIVQVCPSLLNLLAGSNSLVQVPLAELLLELDADPDEVEELGITAACVQDPYVLLQLSNGQCLLLRYGDVANPLVPVEESLEVLMMSPAAGPLEGITAAWVARDCSGWLSKALGRPGQGSGGKEAGAAEVAEAGDAAAAPEAAAGAADAAAGADVAAPASGVGAAAKEGEAGHSSADGGGDGSVGAPAAEDGAGTAAAGGAADGPDGAVQAAADQQAMEVDGQEQQEQQEQQSEAQSQQQEKQQEQQQEGKSPEQQPQQECKSPQQEQQEQAQQPEVQSPQEMQEPDAQQGSGSSHSISTDPCYCFIARASGALEAYALPSMELVFSCSRLAAGKALLRNKQQGQQQQEEQEQQQAGGDAMHADAAAGADAMPAGAANGHGSAAAGRTVVELQVDSFSADPGSGAMPDMERPALTACLSDGTVLVYQAFCYEPEGRGSSSTAAAAGAAPGSSGSAAGAQPQEAAAGTGVGFRRLHLDTSGADRPLPSSAASLPHVRRLVRFDGLGPEPVRPSGISGVFIGGAAPLMLVAGRGTLAVTPLPAEGAVLAFTHLNNANCEQGFVASCFDAATAPAGAMRLFELPAKVQMGPVAGGWCSRRVLLQATPSHVSWYNEARLLALVLSRQAKYKQWLPLEQDGDPSAGAAYAAADEHAKHTGKEERQEVVLYDHPALNPIYRYTLQPGEVATSVKPVHLASSGTDTSPGAVPAGSVQPLVAVTTGQGFGEDSKCMGRVLLFRVQKQEEPAEGESQWGVTLVAAKDCASAVTACATLGSMLLLGTGQQLELYRWGGSTSLTKISFYDVPQLVTSLDVLNGQSSKYILVGDLDASAHFVRYIAEGNKLDGMGRDFDHRQAVCTRFQINGNILNFLVADGSGTVRVLRYDSKHDESWRGKRLLPEAALHTGHCFASSVRTQLKLPAEEKGRRQAVVISSKAGSLEVVAPVLYMAEHSVLVQVQQQLVLAAAHVAGLNPRAFRRRHLLLGKWQGAGHTHYKAMPEVMMLDGDLLLEFLWLEEQQQRQVAEACGSSVQEVLAMMGKVVGRLGTL